MKLTLDRRNIIEQAMLRAAGDNLPITFDDADWDSLREELIDVIDRVFEDWEKRHEQETP